MVRTLSRLVACRIVHALLVAALLFPATALAQFDTATVLGAVSDQIRRGRARRDRHAEEHRHRHHRDRR